MTARQCAEHSIECMRLSNLAPTSAEARVLRNIAQSWTRLAGQIDRYNTIVRESAVLRKEAS